MSAIHWAAYDPKTGDLIEALPGLRIESSSITHVIGKGGGSINLSMPVKKLSPRWGLALEPLRTIIVAQYDDDARTILWAGTVTDILQGSGPYVSCQVIDFYEWLEGQYLLMDNPEDIDNSSVNQPVPPPLVFNQVDQAQMIKTLGFDFLLKYVNGSAQVTDTGIKRDHTYTADMDKTRLSAMQDVMRYINGPEWMIKWRFESDKLVCVPTVAQKLGRQNPLVLSKVSWERARNSGRGKSGNINTGSALREGDTRFQVTRVDKDLLAAGYLPLEKRWTPDTGSNTPSVIAGYVDSNIVETSLGVVTYAINLKLQDQMVVGRDIDLGDQLEVDLKNVDAPILDHTLKTRMIGYTANVDLVSGQITTISPILYDDEVTA